MGPPDHPRSRGVYPPHYPKWDGGAGSSPLARGLRGNLDALDLSVRIIPARAGFTTVDNHVLAPRTDHPRSRGVYIRMVVLFQPRLGSSPLARGLHYEANKKPGESRIIPARAGFTLEDPWNPNDESPYQTAFTFTADLALAPQSSDSAAVAQRSTRTPSEA